WRWPAAVSYYTLRRSLQSWIDYLCIRIVKISRKRRGHEQCRKCRSIHFCSLSIKHHKYLVVANFDSNALKLVQAIIKIICSPAGRRSEPINVTLRRRFSLTFSPVLGSVGRVPQWRRHSGHFLELYRQALTCSI